MAEINLMDRYPKSARPIDERGSQITTADRAVARRFGAEFFDGTRLQGYGGYRYHPRFWTDTVKRFRDHYKLADSAKVLDVGCAKGFMLHDFKLLMPKMTVAGLDVSQYAIAESMEDMRPFMAVGDATHLPYADKAFDLVISINTIHNLPLDECKQALRELQRVATHAFLTVDAWHNEREHERLLQWNLTAQTYMHVEDWKLLFEETGYAGDYYWFIAE